MVFIFYSQVNITVRINCISTICSSSIFHQTVICSSSTLVLNNITNLFQLIFCSSATAYRISCIHIPIFIIKTSYIVVRISVFTHCYTAGFHSICSRQCLNIKIFVQFNADCSIIAGLRNFSSNITITIYCYFRTKFVRFYIVIISIETKALVDKFIFSIVQLTAVDCIFGISRHIPVSNIRYLLVICIDTCWRYICFTTYSQTAVVDSSTTSCNAI